MYNDEDMIYDKKLHMYILTANCVKNEIGENLDNLASSSDANPATIANRFLTDTSKRLYHYIYSYNPRMKAYNEYKLAKVDDWRESIKDMLLSEVVYALKNGDFWNYINAGARLGISSQEASNGMIQEYTKQIVSELGLDYCGHGRPFKACYESEDY